MTKPFLNALSRRCKAAASARAILAAGLVLSLAASDARADEAAVAQQPQVQVSAPEAVSPEVRAVLSRFGTFLRSDTYGEVWSPTVTPQGWHPYPPCHWVKAKRWNFFFDDQTEWGQIVHHYGRWVHDERLGWLWTPGSTFSPGWVAWRSSPQWTGWAPLPPDQDNVAFTPDLMNGADAWIFQETPQLIAGCDAGAIAPAQQVTTLIEQTPFLRTFMIADNVLVILVPRWVGGAFVDVKVAIKPWTSLAMTKVLSEWNWIWHHTTIKTAKNICLRPVKL